MRKPRIVVTISLLFVGVWLPALAEAKDTPPLRSIACEGSYRHHLQGVCSNERDALYWSFTTTLVKTDAGGRVLAKVPVGNHHGDLCYHDGKVYVAVNFGNFNDPAGNADSWVYVYAAADLALLEKHETQEVVYGAGGIAYHDGKFLVVGGLPEGIEENYAYEYDRDCRFVKRRVIPSGYTRLGIQTATFAEGHWWFGCYGNPKILLRTNPNFGDVERFEFDASLGIVGIGEGRFLVAEGPCTEKEGCRGRLRVAHSSREHGLVIEAESRLSFQSHGRSLAVTFGGKPVAEYVYGDDSVRRPYFRHLRSPSGIQVTRNHPPVEGEDLDDHATMHPGLWLAFGDLNGSDFWRNQGLVHHVEFVRGPESSIDTISWTARNAYVADGRTLCTEDCSIRITAQPSSYFVSWTSTFRAEQDFYFGDQEEMGLGVRVHSPLAVVRGGEIRDDQGRRNETEVWGKQADWCAYRGSIDGRRVGIALMAHPTNFRRPWFHARDYGLLVANPFGRKAFTRADPSKVTVGKGESFTLKFGVIVFDEMLDLSSAYRAFVTSRTP